MRSFSEKSQDLVKILRRLVEKSQGFVFTKQGFVILRHECGAFPSGKTYFYSSKWVTSFCQ